MKTFLYALRGIAVCIRSERNMRIHISAAFFVIMACIVTGASAAEWICVIFCIAAVIGAELFNTAIETLCDAVHPERSRKIEKVKDISAGAVLVLAMMSAVIGGIIFFNGEKISKAVSFFQNHILICGIMILMVSASVFFIFRRYENDK